MDSIFSWLSELSANQLISLGQAFATGILGLAVGWIAFNQYSVNKRRLAIEMYDRELKVVKAVLEEFEGASMQ